jgi:hypothetical protein
MHSLAISFRPRERTRDDLVFAIDALGMNLGRGGPFRVGDWLMVHGRTPDPESGVIGQVIDINWRTTRLRTADDTEIVIPNGVISEKTITNFMAPGELSRFELIFRVDQSYPSSGRHLVNAAVLAAAPGPTWSSPIRAGACRRSRVRRRRRNAAEADPRRTPFALRRCAAPCARAARRARASPP